MMGLLTITPFSDDAADVETILSYDTTKLPDSFLSGESISLVNGDTGTPDVYYQGVLRTTKIFTSTAYRKFIVQWYYPANNTTTTLNNMYWRKGVAGSDTWSAWVLITGV